MNEISSCEEKIRLIRESNDRRRLEQNTQDRKIFLTMFFGWTIFFFIVLAATKSDALAFLLFISLFLGWGISRLFIRFFPVTLDDLNDDTREIQDHSLRLWD